MKYGLLSGILWALDTILLGVLLGITTDDTALVLLAPVISAFFHDLFSAGWLCLYSAVNGTLKTAFRAVRSVNGFALIIGALLGGPIGMTGYVLAIQDIGPGYTACISAFYPAFGAVLAAVFLKERLSGLQYAFFALALAGVFGFGLLTADGTAPQNAQRGLGAAFLCVAGWGSEAVLGSVAMRHSLIDNRVALLVRNIVSSAGYAFCVIPLFGAVSAAVAQSGAIAPGITVCALVGTLSYLCYYKAISNIGPSRAMALNISYSAWAVLMAAVLNRSLPAPVEIFCCLMILIGTVFTACRPQELLKKMQPDQFESL